DAENLRHFFKLGVRDVIPAWKDNAFSGTAFGKNTSLTEEGVRLIELAEELGVMVDVSHLSDAAFAKVCEVAKKPFIASHSNCRALCPSPRNLTDMSSEKEAFREKVRELPRPEADWIVRHIKHAINVGGEDCIGLGGDLDGISSMPRGFETIADYATIPDLLLQAGLKPRQVEKLCFRNFLRVFREVLPR
ncbi:MAG TPA: membrane dipeptidase, partial [Candidatus Acetothermia bacterium]|nr:membrane dipeptidase [Candidatus Acetothermia bacterium]